MKREHRGSCHAGEDTEQRKRNLVEIGTTLGGLQKQHLLLGVPGEKILRQEENYLKEEHSVNQRNSGK